MWISTFSMILLSTFLPYQMFFAVTGAMGHIPTVLKMAPTLFLHTFIQIVVHFTFSVSFGKLFKLPLREIVLASNANVGGTYIVLFGNIYTSDIVEKLPKRAFNCFVIFDFYFDFELDLISI